MGDEYEYYDFMKSTGYWGIILLFAVFAVAIALILFLDIKKRKSYSNGIPDMPGKNRTYLTPAKPDVIELTLDEGVDGDVILYSFEKEQNYPYIVCYKIAKKMQFQKPAAFIINYLPSVNEKTVFEIIPHKETDGSRYMPYLDEFFAKKLNAIRVDPDKIYNKE